MRRTHLNIKFKVKNDIVTRAGGVMKTHFLAGNEYYGVLFEGGSIYAYSENSGKTILIKARDIIVTEKMWDKW